ncbi:MAG: hypothetical protein QXU09_03800, partial [Thermoproteota archaeon]
AEKFFLTKRDFNPQRHINTITALIYNLDHAEETPSVQIYKAFLLTARRLLSELKDNFREKQLLEIEDVRLRTVLEKL